MNKIATFFRESTTARFFIPVGLILMIFGVAVFIINDKNKNYRKTEAIVSRTELVEEAHEDGDGNHVDAVYRVYVKYTVNGNEYEEELGELPGYKQGQKITIYYNPDDPRQITQTKSMILPVIMIAAGALSFICGVVSGMNAIKKYKRMKEQEKGWANGK